jgi:hypothetical protein
MKKFEIREMLQNDIEVPHQVQVKRRKIDANPIECIPLILGRRLLLIKLLYDFQFDGCRIIRIKDITSVRAGESEKFSEFILKEEGILNEIKAPPFVSLDDWGNVFKELNVLEKNIIIECEDIEKGEFYIGKILKINNNSLSFLYFDAVGEWEKESTEIHFKDISSVSFDTRYINIISKYVK